MKSRQTLNVIWTENGRVVSRPDTVQREERGDRRSTQGPKQDYHHPGRSVEHIPQGLSFRQGLAVTD